MTINRKTFHRGSLAALLSALCVTLAPAIASAQATQRTTPEPAPNLGGFKVCNKSSYDLEVAKAVNTAANGQTPNIVSEGWYKFARGECATLWSGKLEYRYYLLYAQNKQSQREWKGDIQVCVSSQAFTIKHGVCESSNYRRGFFQVDTKDYESWTQNLND